jgi:hypothetical protein
MEGFHHLRLMLLDSAMFVSCLGWDKIYVHPVINVTCTNKGVAYQDSLKMQGAPWKVGRNIRANKETLDC